MRRTLRREGPVSCRASLRRVSRALRELPRFGIHDANYQQSRALLLIQRIEPFLDILRETRRCQRYFLYGLKPVEETTPLRQKAYQPIDALRLRQRGRQ